MSRFDPTPRILEDEIVRLEPLSTDHAEELFHAGQEPDIWQYMPIPGFRTVEDTLAWIDESLAEQSKGLHLPFAIVHKGEGRAVGSTRYLDIQRPHRSLEIGWTWIAPQFQRTAVNTECKFLLLRHAFEDLDTSRVTIKTDRRNERSQKAIERIGAKREGILRNHYIMWDGYVRDSVFYSVIDSEWPSVKAHLLGLLQRSVTP